MLTAVAFRFYSWHLFWSLSAFVLIAADIKCATWRLIYCYSHFLDLIFCTLSNHSFWEHLLISKCVKCEWQQYPWLALSLGISHHNRSITLEPLCKQSVLEWRSHFKMIALHKQNATVLFLPCCPPPLPHTPLSTLLSFSPYFPLSKFSFVPMPFKDI